MREVVVVARAQRGERARSSDDDSAGVQAGAELRVVADAVGDRRQAAAVVDALRRLGVDAVAAAAGLACPAAAAARAA